jgi:hypothetical protein
MIVHNSFCALASSFPPPPLVVVVVVAADFSTRTKVNRGRSILLVQIFHFCCNTHFVFSYLQFFFFKLSHPPRLYLVAFNSQPFLKAPPTLISLNNCFGLLPFLLILQLGPHRRTPPSPYHLPLLHIINPLSRQGCLLYFVHLPYLISINRPGLCLHSVHLGCHYPPATLLLPWCTRIERQSELLRT